MAWDTRYPINNHEISLDQIIPDGYRGKILLVLFLNRMMIVILGLLVELNIFAR
jgi:hypothetical protein